MTLRARAAARDATRSPARSPRKTAVLAHSTASRFRAIDGATGNEALTGSSGRPVSGPDIRIVRPPPAAAAPRRTRHL